MSINFIDIYVGYHQEFLRNYDNNIDYSFSNETIMKLLEHHRITDDGTVENFINRLLKVEAIIDSNPNTTLQELLRRVNPKLQYQIKANWKTVEAIFKEYYNERFYIIWGYYSILDAESKSLLYLLGKNFREDNSNISNIEAFWNFNYIPIPTSISNTSIGNIIKKISLDDKRFLNKEFHETPTIYRANSWTLDENKLKELFSNTYIQKLNSTSSFSVILTEEVLFFLYAFLHFDSNDIGKAAIWKKLHLSENYKKEKFYIPIVPNLKQLCKFALSVESLILKGNQKPLLNYFELSEHWKDWKCDEELSLRRKIDTFIDSKLVRLPIDKFLEELHPKIVAIFELLISHTKDYIISIENSKIKKQLLQKYFNTSTNKLGVIEFLARFNIEASKLILEDSTQETLHDIFMFPMVKTWKEGFRTNNLPYDDCLKDDKEVEINIPVIMTTYINSLYSINGALDEDKNSLNGFNITMEVCRNLAKPIVESEFYGRVIKSKLLPKALQSAVAQVFARNFAHNIGSHVAIRATNRMAKERIAELYKIDKLTFKDNPAIEDWLDYMGEKLDLFEVARNEFLAEYKLPAKNAMLYRDVILPFCENTLLMDNIAHSEGVHYGENGFSNKLRIKVLIKDKSKSKGIEIKAEYPHLKGYNIDDKIVYPDNFPYLVESREIEIGERKIKYSIDESFSSKLLTGANDIEICLTNEHTIYSILENLIRNSAKHNKDELQKQNKHLVITINIEDTGDEDYYKIQIYDNVSKVTKEQLNKFAKSIAASLITNDGEIQKESLGIADIKINAHLLKTDADITPRNLSDALTLVYQESESKIFDEYKTEENLSEEKKYNFGYQFKLCKPKKVVWIGKADDNNLKKKGIICIENYKNFKPEGQAKTEEPLANYQFAILELGAIKDLSNEAPNYEWDDFLIKLPHRVLINCTEKEWNTIKDKKPGFEDLKTNGRIQLVNEKLTVNTENQNWDFEFLKTCWENWLIAKYNLGVKRKGKLIVYFEDETFTKKWMNIGFNEKDIIDVIALSSKTENNNTNLTGDTEKLNSTNGENVFVIFDHHSKVLNSSQTFGSKIECVEKDGYFAFDKSSTDYVELCFPPDDNHKKVLIAYELFDAGLKKVFIVDERIAELTDRENKTGEDIAAITGDTKFISKSSGGRLQPKLNDLCNNGNTFIINRIRLENNLNIEKPTKDLDINKSENVELKIISNQQKVDTLNYKFNSLINSKEAPNFRHLISNFELVKPFGVDVLIIHRTFLQEIFSYFSHLEHKEIMHQFYKSYKRVVVVSGGGFPHSFKLDNNLNFKPFSRLQKCFGIYVSKYSINKII